MRIAIVVEILQNYSKRVDNHSSSLSVEMLQWLESFIILNFLLHSACGVAFDDCKSRAGVSFLQILCSELADPGTSARNNPDEEVAEIVLNLSALRVESSAERAVFFLNFEGGAFLGRGGFGQVHLVHVVEQGSGFPEYVAMKYTYDADKRARELIVLEHMKRNPHDLDMRVPARFDQGFLTERLNCRSAVVTRQPLVVDLPERTRSVPPDEWPQSSNSCQPIKVKTLKYF